MTQKILPSNYPIYPTERYIYIYFGFSEEANKIALGLRLQVSTTKFKYKTIAKYIEALVKVQQVVVSSIPWFANALCHIFSEALIV